MDKDQPISRKDEALAKAFGEYLDAERTLDSVNDPLLPVLNAFKDSYQNDVFPNQKDHLWNKIDSKLAQTSSPLPAPNVRSIPSVVRWFAAAALILLVGLMLLKWLNTSGDLPSYASSSDKIELTLSDGTKVQLRPYSTLIKIPSEEGIERYLLEGEAYFDVAKKANRIFEVQTALGSIEVLGTQFNLSYRNQQMQVYLKEGLVNVTNSSQTNAIKLKPSQAAIIDSLGVIQLEEEVDEKIYLDWLSAALFFSDTPLSDIIPELEQHFSIKIAIPDSVIHTKISGSITLASVEETLDYMGIILEGSFKKQEEGVFLFLVNE